MDALIGHTGYIGSALALQHPFARTFNSRNIGEVAGTPFGTVVCAAAPGSMLEANRRPERDAETIDRLIAHLRHVEAERFVLISTIAVLRGFAAADEDHADYETDLPYGVNRRRLETFVLERFERPLVVRLPALFGGTLRKNFLFDMLNPVPTMLDRDRLDVMKHRLGGDWGSVIDTLYVWNDALSLLVIDRAKLNASGRRAELERLVEAEGGAALRFTHRDSRFQFYDIGRLWSDIRRAQAAGMPVLHLAPVPIAAGTIYEALRGAPMPATDARIHREDMRTKYAALWGKTGAYTIEADEVVAGIKRYFVKAQTS